MFSGLKEVNKIYKVDLDLKFEHYYENRPLIESKVKELQTSLR